MVKNSLAAWNLMVSHTHARPPHPYNFTHTHTLRKKEGSLKCPQSAYRWSRFITVYLKKETDEYELSNSELPNWWMLLPLDHSSRLPLRLWLCNNKSHGKEITRQSSLKVHGWGDNNPTHTFSHLRKVHYMELLQIPAWVALSPQTILNF